MSCSTYYLQVVCVLDLISNIVFIIHEENEIFHSDRFDQATRSKVETYFYIYVGLLLISPILGIYFFN